MNHDKFYARYAYEAMLLQQPHIGFEGLWKVGPMYCILCPALAQAPVTVDGKPLVEWFDNECRPAGSPVRLVGNVPEGSMRISERTVEELSLLHGEPLTGPEVGLEIAAALPKQFPLEVVVARNAKLIFNVSRPLLEDEQIELEIAMSNLKIDLPHEVLVRPGAAEEQEKKTSEIKKLLGEGDLALQAGRALGGTFPASLRHAYSEDEEFWVDNRLRLFSESNIAKGELLPSDFVQSNSACFVEATSFKPRNIRNYLPIYHRVILAMPLASRLEEALIGLGVERAELLELVRRGRVQFALPQPLHRYDARFLAEVLDARTGSLIFSRRLCMSSVVEARARAPFLYPTFGSLERRRLIEVFESVDDPRYGPIARAVGRSMGKAWVGMERTISQRGATANLSYGVGPLLASLIQQLTGKKLAIELAFSGASVGWAAALGATYFPFEGDGFSEAKAASLCASMYSGVRNAPLVNPLRDFNVFVEGLLTIDNDAPVLEVDDVFTAKDIDRLGAFLKGIDPEGTGDDVLKSLNEKVARFERNEGRLNRLDILSLGGAAAGALTSNVYLPLGAWVVQYLLSKADPSVDVGGKIVDWVRAANARTTTNAVLISRIRRKL